MEVRRRRQAAVVRRPRAAPGWRTWATGTTRVHFSETYHAFNPIMRLLLEKRVHDFISKDNDRLIRDSLTNGVQMMRAARAKRRATRTTTLSYRLIGYRLTGLARSASAAARARKARPRCEMACFSSGVISAKVRPSPSSGTKTGS